MNNQKLLLVDVFLGMFRAALMWWLIKLTYGGFTWHFAPFFPYEHPGFCFMWVGIQIATEKSSKLQGQNSTWQAPAKAENRLQDVLCFNLDFISITEKGIVTSDFFFACISDLQHSRAAAVFWLHCRVRLCIFFRVKSLSGSFMLASFKLSMLGESAASSSVWFWKQRKK